MWPRRAVCQPNPLSRRAGSIFALICAISLPAGIGAIRGIAGGFDRLGMGASEMSFVRLSAAALVAMATAACSGNPETGTGPRENTGTLIGAVAGGLIGSQFSGTQPAAPFPPRFSSKNCPSPTHRDQRIYPQQDVDSLPAFEWEPLECPGRQKARIQARAARIRP